MAATNGANVPAMVVGVLLFVVGYTALTCTQRFERFYRRPFMRTTLYVGYGLRLLLSALTVAMLFGFVFPLVPDLVCGMVSVLGVKAVVGVSEDQLLSHFGGALLVTCVQGAILNAVVGVAMAICYAFLRAFGRSPVEPRGFEVIPHGRRGDSTG